MKFLQSLLGVLALAFFFELVSEHCSAGIFTQDHLIVHVGTQVYGDIQVGPNGELTVLNGKTLDQAAASFWPAIRVRYKAISDNIRNGTETVDRIGFYFKANKGQLRMTRGEKKISWKNYDPRPEDLPVWDAICIAYQP